MPRSIRILVAASIGVLSLLALYRLLALEYESGDRYPEYSSFRTDPLGTLAFYEALGSLSETTTRRNLQELGRADIPPGSSLLFAGAQLGPDDVSTLERLETHVAAGGQLVILFQPYPVEPWYFFEDSEELSDEEESETTSEEDVEAEGEDAESLTDDEDENGDDETDREELLRPKEDISERWGFDYDIHEPGFGDDFVEYVTRSEGAPIELPEKLPWHSGRYFENLHEDWRVIYARDDRPAVVARDWGSGRIVIAMDNYLATNEAMFSNREAEYLTWLVGDSRTVIFDETHLGVERTTGVMTLVRHYNLLPVLFVCIILALMFIWKSAATLVPRRASVYDEEDSVEAFSTTAGMANLARRAVAQSDAPEACWKLYLQPSTWGRPPDVRTHNAVQGILAEFRGSPRRKKDPVQVYNRIFSVLNERKRRS